MAIPCNTFTLNKVRHGDYLGDVHYETRQASDIFIVKAGPAAGAQVLVPVFSVTESVATRWCDVCGAWVEARGIMGALLCPCCHTSWDREVPTA